MRKSHSFLKASPKSLFDMMTSIWMIFTLLAVIVLLIFSFIISIKTSDYRERIVSLKDEKASMHLNITKQDEAADIIMLKSKQAQSVSISNTMLNDSIRNFFDLVPEQITLNKVELSENGMTLYGVTPTKDAYNFLLLSPLKSIFNINKTMFFLNEKGWYNFVSKNMTENNEEKGQ